MTISIKQKALLYTIALFASVAVGSYVLALIIDAFSRETVTNVIFGVGVIWCFYIGYQMFVAHFEYKEKVKKYDN